MERRLDRDVIDSLRAYESAMGDYYIVFNMDALFRGDMKSRYEAYAAALPWMLRDEIRLRLTSHSELIALLAQIGRARGYDIWIGRREQPDRAGGLAPNVLLRDLMSVKRPDALTGE